MVQEATRLARDDPEKCHSIVSGGKQCPNGYTTDAADEGARLCGTHAKANRVKRIDAVDGEPYQELRDDLAELGLSSTRAYHLGTLTDDVGELWRIASGLEDVDLGGKVYEGGKLAGIAKEIAEHPEIDAENHPLNHSNCVALQGSSAKNHSCPNGAYGASLLCGMHKDADLPGTLLDAGEPGPDLDTVTVDGAEYQLIEERGGDLIVVDPREWEVVRLEGSAGAETRWGEKATAPDLSDDAETLVLVGCGDAKADEPRKAKDLYTSNYFGLKRQYAEEYGDEWAILSAKYGLLDPEAEIEPYDVSADDVDVGEWGVAVAEYLPDVNDTTVILLAGPDYSEEVEGTLFMYGADVETPTEGKKIGERMSWLSEQLEEAEDREPEPILPRAEEGDCVRVELEDGRAYEGRLADRGTGGWRSDRVSIYLADVDAVRDTLVVERMNEEGAELEAADLSYGEDDHDNHRDDLGAVATLDVLEEPADPGDLRGDLADLARELESLCGPSVEVYETLEAGNHPNAEEAEAVWRRIDELVEDAKAAGTAVELAEADVIDASISREQVVEELARMLERGLSPSQALDYYATQSGDVDGVETHGEYSQSGWAERRDRSQQAISESVRGARSVLEGSDE